MNLNIANARINTKAFISKLKQIIYIFFYTEFKKYTGFFFFNSPGSQSWLRPLGPLTGEASPLLSLELPHARTHVHTPANRSPHQSEGTLAGRHTESLHRQEVSECVWNVCFFFLLTLRLSQLLDAPGERVSVRSDHGGKNNPSLLQKAELTIVLFLKSRFHNWGRMFPWRRALVSTFKRVNRPATPSQKKRICWVQCFGGGEKKNKKNDLMALFAFSGLFHPNMGGKTLLLNLGWVHSAENNTALLNIGMQTCGEIRKKRGRHSHS